MTDSDSTLRSTICPSCAHGLSTTLPTTKIAARGPVEKVNEKPGIRRELADARDERGSCECLHAKGTAHDVPHDRHTHELGQPSDDTHRASCPPVFVARLTDADVSRSCPLELGVDLANALLLSPADGDFAREVAFGRMNFDRHADVDVLEANEAFAVAYEI